MGGKTLKERIKEAEERARTAQARVKALESMAKKKERKERTRLLIQVGGIFASIGIEYLDQANRAKEVLVSMATKGEWTKGRVQYIFGGDPPEKFQEALNPQGAPEGKDKVEA